MRRRRGGYGSRRHQSRNRPAQAWAPVRMTPERWNCVSAARCRKMSKSKRDASMSRLIRAKFVSGQSPNSGTPPHANR
ncbi:hypothetical protein KCP77_05085 [Salmonella enterica subsp. enterica]|nr:hypothetical protein KCP77_05085 [Salmonella enterica subsp. enterica]